MITAPATRIVPAAATDEGPTRVLWLVKGLGRGGAERLVVEAAGHLDRDRYAVEVAYVLPFKDALVGELHALGVPTHCIGTARRPDLAWPWRLRRLLRDGRYRIVHTHMPVPAAAARLLAPRRGTVLMHTEHNVWARHRRLSRWANALTYRRNDAVIAVSDAVAASIAPRRLRGVPLSVVRHGAVAQPRDGAAAARAHIRSELGLAADDLVLGTVGNLTAKKDHHGLLTAVAALRADLPRLRLVIVGTGPLDAELRARARERDLDGVVTFTGMRSDVPDLLAAFDVFVLSSRFEGLPIALVEALHAGLPSVVTDAGGTTEVVRPDVEALVVPCNDPAALAGALRTVLTDASLRGRLAAAAKQRAALFGPERGAAALHDLYAAATR